MPSPKKGSVVYTEPRAVQVNGKYIDGIDDTEPHSVVHGSISVIVSDKRQAQQIMAHWDYLVETFDEQVQLIKRGVESDGEEEKANTGP